MATRQAELELELEPGFLLASLLGPTGDLRRQREGGCVEDLDVFQQMGDAVQRGGVQGVQDQGAGIRLEEELTGVPVILRGGGDLVAPFRLPRVRLRNGRTGRGRLTDGKPVEGEP
ncbi:MAG: hypothetical protein DRO11_07110 [Methanobacteriota archaeon]|nr:MAG: hypothetical protein DRO11_07110 [Euryarchaeota archaeon]